MIPPSLPVLVEHGGFHVFVTSCARICVCADDRRVRGILSFCSFTGSVAVAITGAQPDGRSINIGLYSHRSRDSRQSCLQPRRLECAGWFHCDVDQHRRGRAHIDIRYSNLGLRICRATRTVLRHLPGRGDVPLSLCYSSGHGWNGHRPVATHDRCRNDCKPWLRLIAKLHRVVFPTSREQGGGLHPFAVARVLRRARVNSRRNRIRSVSIWSGRSRYIYLTSRGSRHG